jgi:3-deoxy-D-manno-octulosonic acid kinase
VSEDLFHPRGWQSVTPVTGALRAAGRGNTLLVSDSKTDFVLRKYVRGGMIGRLIKDTYFWNGEDETRCFAEWRLLRKLIQKGLNVPIPAAARYRRTAMFYTADLLTVRIPGIRSLAERLLEAPGSPEFWQALGVAICRVHAADVYHADMNAYNIQLDPDDEVWLLDFDRGELARTGTWKQETLSRLHRSLQKIKRLSPGLFYTDFDWEQFLDGYFSESRSE